MVKRSVPPRGVKSTSQSARSQSPGHRGPASRKAAHREDLPDGTQDLPGFANLPKISNLLSVGNQCSAAHGSFGAVISTTTPLGVDGAPADWLSTVSIPYKDGHGRESRAAAKSARSCIVRGAAAVAAAISKGKRTLVHCEWGQNRSGAICCAYAVLWKRWKAEDAINHVMESNRAMRCYSGQRPMCNEVFNGIIAALERDRESVLAECGKV
mmetsp:Transcript_9316/g.20731  ORF Transcript_9316/g.20731 Transcript_9316/m.20731 type:complete len:212 (-) Transcript_9316:125-760(-)